MNSQPAETKGDFSPIGKGSTFDAISYWAIVAGVYLMVGGLMFYSGKEKLFDGDSHAPAGIQEQFAHSFLHVFPGTDAAWMILGILEFGVFLLLLASFVTGEFLPHRPKRLMQTGLAVSLVTFACLAFGQTATGNHEGSASLYTYFGSTVVILILVSLLPPNRGDRWLSFESAD
ncbi:MAG: hypothetical protein QM648_00070 [Solirubrobacterales bacterium]